MIYIENKRSSLEKLKKKYPDAVIVDVTSKAKDGLVKLSPFYPHGNIPVPFSKEVYAVSVEGVWQGLKVFKNADVDLGSFSNDTMKNIKRTVKKLGPPLGHRCGVKGEKLLTYIEARLKIFLPTYLWVLENKVASIMSKMRVAASKSDLVLLDYSTNSNVLDASKPLSHAALVKAYIEGNYPTDTSAIETKQQRVKEGTTTSKKPARGNKQKVAKAKGERSKKSTEINTSTSNKKQLELFNN